MPTKHIEIVHIYFFAVKQIQILIPINCIVQGATAARARIRKGQDARLGEHPITSVGKASPFQIH